MRRRSGRVDDLARRLAVDRGLELRREPVECVLEAERRHEVERARQREVGEHRPVLGDRIELEERRGRRRAGPVSLAASTPSRSSRSGSRGWDSPAATRASRRPPRARRPTSPATRRCWRSRPGASGSRARSSTRRSTPARSSSRTGSAARSTRSRRTTGRCSAARWSPATTTSWPRSSGSRSSGSARSTTSRRRTRSRRSPRRRPTRWPAGARSARTSCTPRSGRASAPS